MRETFFFKEINSFLIECKNINIFQYIKERIVNYYKDIFSVLHCNKIDNKRVLFLTEFKI